MRRCLVVLKSNVAIGNIIKQNKMCQLLHKKHDVTCKTIMIQPKFELFPYSHSTSTLFGFFNEFPHDNRILMF